MAQDRAPDFSMEAAAGGVVAGVDEAGRGPLAGPVVAAAVILAPGRIPEGVADSKKLSAKRREMLFPEIMASARVGIGEASVAEIDEINILQATLLAMARALRKLPEPPSLVLVDGNRAPKINLAVKTVVGGDAKCLSIAAASIVAKVTRDRTMKALAAQHPGYGWEHNAGYGTAEHRAALARLGVTRHHRSSFAPVRDLMTQDLPSSL